MGSNEMKKYGFGVDIGGTSCKMGLFKTSGELVEKWEIPTDTSNNGAFILENIAKAIEHKMFEKKIDKNEIQGVGLGVPGPVMEDGSVNKCVNLGWGFINVEKVLSDRLMLPVKTGNDANVAALGEMWQGGGRGYRNMIMVTLGTGVGGGVIINGKIVPGSHGAGGEIGHIKMKDNEKETCGCGKCGCLEQYASATGIVRMANNYLLKNEIATILKNKKELTAKDVFDAAKADDAVALELVEELGRMLGTALANISCVVDPEVIVIGGGVSKAGQILIDAVRKHYVERTFHACEKTQFALAALGNDAGMYGCVQLILN
jgi:glucokinase